MSAPARLLSFVDDELARSAPMVERCVAGTLALLRDSRDGLAQSERERQFELVEALQRQGARYQARFVEALREGVRRELAAADGASAATHAAPAALELMDESRVETDIEISRALQLIDSTAEWERRELQTFTSTLCGLDHVSEESNPLRPIVYATALWEAACAIVAAPAHRATLLRLSAGVMAGLLKTAWAAASSRLEAAGVQPGVYRTVLLAPGAVSGRSAGARDAAHAGMLGPLLASVPAGELAPLPGGAAGLPAAPAGGDGRVAALLTRLFAAIQADTLVGAPVRAVLARLQVAALRVALQDGGMLDAPAHPAWQLMNRIAAAGRSYPAPGDKRLAALLTFCDALAEEVARAQVADATPLRRALARVDTFLAEQLQWQLREAQPAVESLRRAERRDVLEQVLSQRLTEQMATVSAPAGIRRFVTATWAKVLAEAMVRFGEHAGPTPGYLRAVDDLLWSLAPPAHPQSRQRLVALLPGLLQRLRGGMALIGLPEAEQQALLDALMPIHAEALRPAARAASEKLTAEQIVQRMRDEVIPETPLPRPFSDSVIDLASMDTVPADFLHTDIGAPEEAARRVDRLQPGERLRLFVRGRWTRVQLLWRSDGGLYLLFAGEQPGQTHSITRSALERLDGAGLLQPQEDKPLVQRAIDTLVNELPLPG
ncbi:DUF1631 family protein [Piscinibacter sp.]|uniref:DUF1631 family protein n=1 Tax=Piscinibacter sp. TaxID=1903157 RepID=UPI0039E2D83E